MGFLQSSNYRVPDPLLIAWPTQTRLDPKIDICPGSANVQYLCLLAGLELGPHEKIVAATRDARDWSQPSSNHRCCGKLLNGG